MILLESVACTKKRDRLDRFCGCRLWWRMCFNKTSQMDVWVLPKCIRKCDIVFRGVWVKGWRGEGVVSFSSPGPCVATLLNQLTPLARGHSSAGPVQPAPIGVRWGLWWCLTHCWTSPLSSYGLTPPLRSRRTVNPKHSKVNSDTGEHWFTHKYQEKLKMELQMFFPGKPHTLLHHREHGCTTLHLLWALGTYFLEISSYKFADILVCLQHKVVWRLLP